MECVLIIIWMQMVRNPSQPQEHNLCKFSQRTRETIRNLGAWKDLRSSYWSRAIFVPPKNWPKIGTSRKLDPPVCQNNQFLQSHFCWTCLKHSPFPPGPIPVVKSLQGPLRLSQQLHPFPCFRLGWKVHAWWFSLLFLDSFIFTLPDPQKILWLTS